MPPYPAVVRVVSMVSGLLLAAAGAGAAELRAGAAAVRLEATDDMVIGGSIGPVFVHGQEGELRASAVIVEGPDGGKVCLVSCDVLMVGRDTLDAAARTI